MSRRRACSRSSAREDRRGRPPSAPRPRCTPWRARGASSSFSSLALPSRTKRSAATSASKIPTARSWSASAYRRQPSMPIRSASRSISPCSEASCGSSASARIKRRLGPLDVAERRLRHLGQRAKRPRAIRRLGLRPEAQLERRGELLVLARRAEHRLERVGGVGAQLVARLADAADRRDRLLVEAAGEDLAVRLERRLRVLELHGVERRDPLLQRAPCRLVGSRPRPGASGCRAARATGARACRERRGGAGPRRPCRARASACTRHSIASRRSDRSLS